MLTQADINSEKKYYIMKHLVFFLSTFCVLNLNGQSLWTEVGLGVHNGPTANQWGSGSGDVMALIDFNGLLYLGGRFDTAGINPAQNLATWDGNQYASLNVNFGTSVSARIRAFTAYNGHLIVGGIIDSINGVPYGNVAQWDGTSWSPLGSLNNEVNALMVFNNELYATGMFTLNGNLTYAAKWDGVQWNRIGTAIPNSSGYSITVYNNEIYVGGYFLESIKKWDGTDWVSVGGGTNTTGMFCCAVNSLGVYNNELFAGGQFQQLGGITMYGIGRWNNMNWDSLYYPVMPLVFAITEFQNSLYFGGGWLQFQVQNIIRWDSTGHQTLGLLPVIMSLQTFNNELYAGTENSLWKIDTNLLSIEINEANNNFKIYPNPSSGNFTISFPHVISKGVIEIFNVFGEKVFSEKIIKASEKVIYNKNNSSGIYFLKVHDEAKQYCKKIIIEQD